MPHPTVAMALTLVQVTEYITTLEGALARGERRVQFADRAVEYNGPESILKAINYYKSLLNEMNGRPKQTLVVSSKGF